MFQVIGRMDQSSVHCPSTEAIPEPPELARIRDNSAGRPGTVPPSGAHLQWRLNGYLQVLRSQRHLCSGGPHRLGDCWGPGGCTKQRSSLHLLTQGLYLSHSQGKGDFMSTYYVNKNNFKAPAFLSVKNISLLFFLTGKRK